MIFKISLPSTIAGLIRFTNAAFKHINIQEKNWFRLLSLRVFSVCLKTFRDLVATHDERLIICVKYGQLIIVSGSRETKLATLTAKSKVLFFISICILDILLKLPLYYSQAMVFNTEILEFFLLVPCTSPQVLTFASCYIESSV
jgi:hypothetical protein